MTLKECTIVSIEIEGREVDIDVEAPNRAEMMLFLVPSLPEAVLDDDVPEDGLTLDEAVDAAYELADATTDLPRDLIEQLPAKAVEDLADAAQLVIQQQTRVWERTEARNDYDIDHTQISYEFIADGPDE